VQHNMQRMHGIMASVRDRGSMHGMEAAWKPRVALEAQASGFVAQGPDRVALPQARAAAFSCQRKHLPCHQTKHERHLSRSGASARSGRGTANADRTGLQGTFKKCTVTHGCCAL
jgi:hypothetical protein